MLAPRFTEWDYESQVQIDLWRKQNWKLEQEIELKQGHVNRLVNQFLATMEGVETLISENELLKLEIKQAQPMRGTTEQAKLHAGDLAFPKRGHRSGFSKFLQQLCKAASQNDPPWQGTFDDGLAYFNVPDFGILPCSLLVACAGFLDGNPGFDAVSATDVVNRYASHHEQNSSLRVPRSAADAPPRSFSSASATACDATQQVAQPSFASTSSGLRRPGLQVPASDWAPSAIAARAHSGQAAPFIVAPAQWPSRGSGHTEFSRQSPSLMPGSLASASSSAAASLSAMPQMNSEQAAPRTTTVGPHVVTLIVRNIPARITQQHLLEFWPPMGVYDMLHLPYDHRRKCNVGKAFINFVSHEAAMTFWDQWNDKFLVPKAKVKKLSITVADTQGLWAYIEKVWSTATGPRYKNKMDMPVIINPDGSLRDVRHLFRQMRGRFEEHDGAIEGWRADHVEVEATTDVFNSIADDPFERFEAEVLDPSIAAPEFSYQ